MIYVDRNINTPIYRQIYEQIKRAVIEGEMAESERLPSTRALAAELCIGRNTVENAYQQLLAEGYVSSRGGSGYMVKDVAAELFLNENRLIRTVDDNIKQINMATDNANDALHPPILVDFHLKNVSIDSFPDNIWRKCAAQVLSYRSNNRFASYNNDQGELNLRMEILKYIQKMRGIVCKIEQIVVCSGLQFALEKIISILLAEYCRHIGMENPGSDLVRLLFEKRFSEVVPIPVYPHKNFVDALYDSKVRTVFLTPSHQFPTGYVIPINTRHEILDWAQSNDCYIIEDDYDCENRYGIKPLPAIHSLDTNERVIYIGSFSKVLSPCLRINYIILPEHLLPLYYAEYKNTHSPTSWILQETLALYMREGHLDTHMRKTHKLYKKRHSCVIHAIEKYFGSVVDVEGHTAGLHVMLKVKGAQGQVDLMYKAQERGVKIYPAARYWMSAENCPTDTVVIGYAQLEEQNIDNGIRLLKKAWF